MDSLTHILMGASIGQLTLGKKLGKKAIVWGAIAANIPDFDGVFQYFFSPASSTLFHRGISHSLFLMILLAPFVAWGINKLYKGDSYLYKGWLRLVFFAWSSHLFLDIFNSYGTGLFEPFSRARIAYDAIGITDFIFAFPLLVAAIYSFISKNKSKLSFYVPIIALSLSFIYLGFTIVNKQQVNSFAKNELYRKGIYPKRILTSPLPITNFAWMVVAEDDKGFWKGTYSVTTENKIDFEYIPKNHELAESIEGIKDYKKLQRFSKGYYILRKGAEGELILSDLRFGTLSNEQQGTLGGGLNFVLTPNTDEGKLKVGRSHPKRNVTTKNIKNYFKRISKKS